LKTALSHAAAGADIVAPSDMMDGRVGAIREALDERGFDQTAIMSYAANSPRLSTGHSARLPRARPSSATGAPIQMDFANANEALREVALDIDEGADIVMVKPALPYMDILWRVRERFRKPTAVYHCERRVAMVKSAVEKGYLNERDAVIEIMTALKRAGADINCHLLGTRTREMAAGIKRARGETERHAGLKRLAFLWAQAQGYSAVRYGSESAKLPVRADVAAYRLAPKKIGSIAIFECKQALCDLRRVIVRARPPGSDSKRFPNAASFSKARLRAHYPNLRNGDSLFREFDLPDFTVVRAPWLRATLA